MGKPNIRMSECLECTSSTLQESDVSEVGTYPVYGANGIVGYLNGYNTHIYFKDYGKAHIFCPSYSEQLKYAKFLSTIDDKLLVEQNILINLSLQKQYLLLQMFI